MYCWSIDYFTDYFSRYLQKSIYFGARLIYDLSWWRPLFNHPNAAVTMIQSPWKCGSWNAPLPKIPRPLARPSVGPFQTLVPQLPTLRALSDILLYWSTLIGKSLHLGKSGRGSTDKFETEQQVFWDTANKKGMWKRNAKNGETTNQSFLQTSSEFWKCWICEQFLLISSQFTDVWYVNVANLEE